MAKKWMQKATAHMKKGALTRSAKRAGMSPMSFARAHYHDKGVTGRRARFAVNAQKWRKH